MRFDVEFAGRAFLAAVGGSPVSFLLTFGALIIAFPLGFATGLICFKRVKVLDKIISVIVSFLRGTPIVVQIFIVYSGLPRVLNQIGTALNWSIDFYSMNRYVYGIAVFALSLSAVLCEVFRSALSSVNKTQMEAAKSVSLSSFQAYRLIILPQALVSAVPNICMATLNIFKATSLVYIMALHDITGAARTIAGESYQYIEAYTVIFFIYIVLCFLMQKGSVLLENQLKHYRSPSVGKSVEAKTNR